MKKLLSMLLAFLFIFSHGGASGYQTEDLPDGGKKITLKYDDLENINSDYEEVYNNKIKPDCKFKHKVCDKLDSASYYVGIGCIFTGIIVSLLGMSDQYENKKSWWKKLLCGMGLAILGSVAIIGTPTLLSNTLDSQYHKNECLESQMADFQCIHKNEENKENFHYDIFVNKKGNVYKVETSSKHSLYNAICDAKGLSETQYKFPLEIK